MFEQSFHCKLNQDQERERSPDRELEVGSWLAARWFLGGGEVDGKKRSAGRVKVGHLGGKRREVKERFDCTLDTFENLSRMSTERDDQKMGQLPAN